MYKEVLVANGVQQTIGFTAQVLSYEVGDIHKAIVYLARFGTNDLARAGYEAELRIACADGLTMLGLITEQAGLDYEDTLQFGMSRFKTRMENVARGIK